MKTHPHLPPVRLDAPNLPHVDLDTVRDHLIAHHAVTGLGLPIAVEYSASELLAWHDADHRLLDPVGIPLEHRHTDITTAAAPGKVVDSGRLIHEGNLRAVREGKRIANLAEILDRAAQVQARRNRPTVTTATGATRTVGGDVLSQYDRDCIEIAQAVAERAARRAKRTRGAA